LIVGDFTLKMINSEYKVLLVDDLPKNLEIIGEILISAEYQVIKCSGGEEALFTLKQKNFDIILLDVSMPDIDGFEVCRRLKLEEKTKEIPVIFITALTEVDSIVKGFEVGGVDYINKPVKAKELLQRVSTHIKNKTQKDLILKQNEDLTEYNKKIKVLAQELKQKNAELLSSIHYAKFIQQATLPSEIYLSQYLPLNFIIYLPRDIVSGDFYWVKQHNNQIMIAAVDCTGHGVPGALLSMLGITYLNEIVANYRISKEIKAGEVLNILRDRIKETLHQYKNDKLTRDGMDIALCIIDLETKMMQYAGAHSPIYLVRYNKEQKKYDLFHYKADSMPVANYFKEFPFTNNLIQLETNDQIYMFSDGYIDQFGGENGFKFYAKNFREIILQNAHLPLVDQKIKLLENLEDWKGYHPQIDDILVVGFKIPETFGEDVEFF